MKNEKIRKFLSGDREHVLYWISIWAIVIAGVIYLAQLWFVNYVNQPDLMKCPLKIMVGIPCPGCGGTRAIVSLLKGQFLSSLYYNAFATYGCVIYGVFFLTQTMQRVTRGRIQGMKYRHRYLWIGIIILILQYLLKLIIPEYSI